MNLGLTSFYSLIFQLLGFLSAAVAGIITARSLGPEYKGILALATLSAYVLWTVLNPCIEASIIHRMGQKKYPVSVLAGNALVLALGLGFLGILLFVSTYDFAKDTLYKGIEFKYLIVAVLPLPFVFVTYYFSSILRGHLDITGYNVATQSLNFCNVFFLLIVLAVWKLSLVEAILASVIGAILGGTYALVKVLKIARGLKVDRRLLALLLKDGGVLYIGALATFVNYQVNFFILNYYSTRSEVGFYSVAYAVANVLFFLSISLESGLFPRIAAASEQEALQLTEVACRQVLIVTTAAAAVMFLFSRQIVWLYGGTQFLPSTKPLMLLLPGIVIAVVPKILAFAWIRKGWFSLLTYVALCAAAVSIALNLFLIPRFGANGAAIATSATFFVVFLLEILLYKRYIGRPLLKLMVPEKSDVGLYRDLFRMFQRNKTPILKD